MKVTISFSINALFLQICIGQSFQPNSMGLNNWQNIESIEYMTVEIDCDSLNTDHTTLHKSDSHVIDYFETPGFITKTETYNEIGALSSLFVNEYVNDTVIKAYLEIPKNNNGFIRRIKKGKWSVESQMIKDGEIVWKGHYTYDSVGNLIRHENTRDGVSEGFTIKRYDENNKIVFASSTYNNKKYSQTVYLYDSSGQLLRRVTFNEKGELKKTNYYNRPDSATLETTEIDHVKGDTTSLSEVSISDEHGNTIKKYIMNEDDCRIKYITIHYKE